MVEPRGLEPLTPCLQSRCATNCAKAPVRDDARGSGSAVDRVGRLSPESLLGLGLLELALRDQGTADGEQDQHDLLHAGLLEGSGPDP